MVGGGQGGDDDGDYEDSDGENDGGRKAQRASKEGKETVRWEKGEPTLQRGGKGKSHVTTACSEGSLRVKPLSNLAGKQT